MDGIVAGVHGHASIGVNNVDIEEFTHRCPSSGTIFLEHRYALDSLRLPTMCVCSMPERRESVPGIG